MTTKAKTKRVRVRLKKEAALLYVKTSTGWRYVKTDEHVITGYTGSIKSLKRLLEIAALDEAEIFRRICNASPLEGVASINAANAIIEALGLAGRRGSKGGK